MRTVNDQMTSRMTSRVLQALARILPSARAAAAGMLALALLQAPLKAQEYTSDSSAPYLNPLASLPTSVLIEEFPVGRIVVLVHAPTGSLSDMVANFAFVRLRTGLGVPVKVVSRERMGNAEALGQLKRRRPDGHTMFLMSSGHFISILDGVGGLEFADFRPIARAWNEPLVIATRCDSYATAEDLIAAARSTSLKFGTTEVVPYGDIAAYLLEEHADTKPPRLAWAEGPEEMGKMLDRSLIDAAVVPVGFVAAGTLGESVCPQMVLARARLPQMPTTPTALELGIRLKLAIFRGFVVHADTPNEIAVELERLLYGSMTDIVFVGLLERSHLGVDAVAKGSEWAEQMALQRSAISLVRPIRMSSFDENWGTSWKRRVHNTLSADRVSGAH